MSTPCFSIPSVDFEIKSVSFLLKVLIGNLKLKKKKKKILVLIHTLNLYELT